MLETMRLETLKLSMRNLRQREVFRFACQILRANGIYVIALKGIVFGTTLYPSPDLKPMADIDLLVTDEDIRRAADLLISYGFVWARPAENHFTEALRDQLPPLVFNGIAIELHRHIMSASAPGTLPVAKLWDNREPFPIAGLTGVFCLNRHFTLFYLCYHIYIHRQGGYLKLIWLADLLFFLRKEQESIDWAWLHQTVREAGLPAMFYIGLAAMEPVFGHILANQALPVVVPTCDVDNLLSLTQPNKRTNIVALQYIRYLPLSQKLSFIFSKLFPSKEYAAKFAQRPVTTSKAMLYLLLYGHYIRRLVFRLGFIRQKPGR